MPSKDFPNNGTLTICPSQQPFHIFTWLDHHGSLWKSLGSFFSGSFLGRPSIIVNIINDNCWVLHQKNQQVYSIITFTACNCITPPYVPYGPFRDMLPFSTLFRLRTVWYPHTLNSQKAYIFLLNKPVWIPIPDAPGKGHTGFLTKNPTFSLRKSWRDGIPRYFEKVYQKNRVTRTTKEIRLAIPAESAILATICMSRPHETPRNIGFRAPKPGENPLDFLKVSGNRGVS